MIRTQSVVLKGLRILGKVCFLAVQVVAAFADDEAKRSRLTAGKAQQLYEDGAISGTEFSKHIHGN
ncbi:hypothetical protein SE948_03120 [Legionella pneumophila]|nr:hypothetical protein [Legionella pneumophila]